MDTIEGGGSVGPQKPIEQATTSPTREKVKAQIEASEARTDTKLAVLVGRIETGFAELRGDLRVVHNDLRVVQDGTSGLKNTVVITGVTVFLGLAAVLVGTLAYGSGAFYNGTVIRDMIEKR